MRLGTIAPLSREATSKLAKKRCDSMDLVDPCAIPNRLYTSDNNWEELAQKNDKPVWFILDERLH